MSLPFISTPLNIPKIEPRDWNEFWDVWIRESRKLVKVGTNHNSAAEWIGFDIYDVPHPDIENMYESRYMPEVLDMFPSIKDNLDKFPLDIKRIRLFCNYKGAIPPHRDMLTDALAVRTLLYDDNPRKTFYYLVNRDGKLEKYYQELPDESNTWMYSELNSLHGVDHYRGHSKILISYLGFKKQDRINELFEEGKQLYGDYVIMP